MSVDLQRLEPENDYDIERVEVTTVDATGHRRVYDISLTDDTVDGGHVLAGSRVDDDAPDESAGGGPSETAWCAAADHFRNEGYEVFSR